MIKNLDVTTAVKTDSVIPEGEIYEQIILLLKKIEKNTAKV